MMAYFIRIKQIKKEILSLISRGREIESHGALHPFIMKGLNYYTLRGKFLPAEALGIKDSTEGVGHCLPLTEPSRELGVRGEWR